MSCGNCNKPCEHPKVISITRKEPRKIEVTSGPREDDLIEIYRMGWEV